ncbi:hypothetical protein PCASD_03438 [Puccinia coronata f. sp. avenae]|uniref:Uncharacterized protein n=1 Tax=Puccinia coronata f. sp. avenae TaxID=200324 RepID=A0A2N5VF51_9BASI|nr:hypothetical protein PCASD_03438 [Puccinia coronata f. sp. avenae]
MEETWVNQRWQGRRPDTRRIGPLSTTAQTLPALTGRTRQFERCSNSRVQPVFGQALSDRRTCRRDQPGPVGQICPTSWLLLWSDSARPTTGQTVPVRPPVEHGCLSTARTAVFDWLMPAVKPTSCQGNG